VDNPNIAPPAHDAGEGRTDSVRDELQEIKRLNAELKKTLAFLSKRVIEQGDLLRQITEELPLVKTDAERGDTLYDTDGLAKRWLVSKRTVETEVAEGNLVPTFIRGARRFTPDAVRAYERTASGLRRRRGARRRAATKSSSRRQEGAAEKAA
jgi:hypothetical protein